jgi:hypothetical protein
MKASVTWPTREAEVDYRRAVDLVLRPHHGNGLDGLLLLRSLAVEGRHPAASWTLRACRRRFYTRGAQKNCFVTYLHYFYIYIYFINLLTVFGRSGSQASGDEDWAAGIDWDVATEVWRVHAERDDHPIAHYLLSSNRDTITVVGHQIVHMMTTIPRRSRSKIFACKASHPWSPHLQRAADLGYPLAIKALAVYTRPTHISHTRSHTRTHTDTHHTHTRRLM